MSALKSGMDRKTARKYLKNPERLSQPRPARDWRTRVDPLAQIWPEAEPRLWAARMEAKALFEHLLMIRPEQMREAPVANVPAAGAAVEAEALAGIESDLPANAPSRGGHAGGLDARQRTRDQHCPAPADHLLCQAVLPYSNWQWATRCQLESLLSLRAGLQAALFRLGKCPSCCRLITAVRPPIKSVAKVN